MPQEPSYIIFLHGASSSGKTTLSKALQAKLPFPFLHYSIDHYRDGGVLPMDRYKKKEFDWKDYRKAFFDGFHHTIVALVTKGNNLLLEHILENEDWKDEVFDLIRHLNVFFIGVHCPLEELNRREKERGDRLIGDAQRDFETIHAYCDYDLEVDTTDALESNVDLIIEEWSRYIKKQ